MTSTYPSRDHLGVRICKDARDIYCSRPNDGFPDDDLRSPRDQRRYQIWGRMMRRLGLRELSAAFFGNGREGTS